MKQYFACILFSLLILPAFSQGAFIIKNNTKQSSEIIGIAEFEKGYLLVGISSPNSSISDSYFLLLDLLGNTIWERIVPAYLPDHIEYYSSVTYHQNYFYIGGYGRKNNESFSTLTKIDLSGNIIFKKEIGSASVLAYDNSIANLLMNENGILIATSGFNNNKTEGELVQVDFDGNILWNHQFFSYDSTSSSYWEYFEDMKKDVNNNFLLTLYTSANNLNFPIKTILKVNSNGEEIWRKSFETLRPSALTEDSLFLHSIAPSKNGNVFAYFSTWASQESTYRTDFAIIEYDAEGNELNYKRYYNPNGFGSTNVFTNAENEIFIAGTRHFEDSLRLSVIKINPNNEIEWDKTYYKEKSSTVDSNTFNAGELFNCGITTSDYGFMITGRDLFTISNEFHYNPTIVKVDCKGNTFWDYNSCISPKFEEIVVFPNPSSDNFIVQIPDVNEGDRVHIKVVDVMGKLIYSSDFTNQNVIQINASTWAEGTYICKIIINENDAKTQKIMKLQY